MAPETAARIRLLCLDVDGVMTDGRLFLDADGRETKCFHIHDGLGIRLWQSTGRQVAIVTGRSSKPLRDRCAELGIELLADGRSDKRPAWEDILRTTGLAADEAAMIGDDLPDLPLIMAAGLGIAVANAVPEVKAAADWTTSRSGGDGAVREAIEAILVATGEWDTLVRQYAGDLLKARDQ
ncbi:MAG: HAD hydrolase family protein [Phycisphaerales bacterium]|nr:HAD hydrolase family protein [Phycisphaerales bacterium]